MRFATLSAQAAAATLALIGVVLPVNTLAAQNATDPNLWLEEVEGERAPCNGPRSVTPRPARP